MRLSHLTSPLTPLRRASATALAATSLLAPAALADVGGTNGVTELASYDSLGQFPADSCHYPSISEDGRHVAFQTQAALLPADTNGMDDVYVVDRQTGSVTCASTTLNGVYGNGTSAAPHISTDGRWVAFSSTSTNLQQLDSNGAMLDVFLKDLQTGTLTRVSDAHLSPSSASGHSDFPSVSDDGRFVAFHSEAVDLIANDTNNANDIFVRDMQTGLTERISEGVWGQSNGGSFFPVISGDGTHVAFQSDASNLILFDNNGALDVFVKPDKLNPLLVSRTPLGAPGNGNSGNASISTTGSHVAFDTDATNIDVADINGATDVYVFEVATLEMELASLAQWQAQGASGAQESQLARDGRSIAFASASSLAPNSSPGYTNIFVRDLEADMTWTASAPSGAATSATGDSDHPVLAQGGAVVAFSSDAADLVPGDPSNKDEVFVRTMHPDPFSYCVSSITSSGCQPFLSSSGFPSLTNADFFSVIGDDLPNQKNGLLFYGFAGPAANPFAGATMCVQGSKKRTPLMGTAGQPVGDDCTGFFVYDMNAFGAGLLGGNPKPELLQFGQQVTLQFWGRDAQSASGSFLTDALQYVVGP